MNQNQHTQQDDYRNRPILVGEEAYKMFEDILHSRQEMEHGSHFPYGIGQTGYFRNTDSKDEEVYTAFDNTDGDCWVEDFKTADGARDYCKGELDAVEIHERESFLDEVRDFISSYAKQPETEVLLPVNINIGEKNPSDGIIFSPLYQTLRAAYSETLNTGRGGSFEIVRVKDLSKLSKAQLGHLLYALSDKKEKNLLVPAYLDDINDFDEEQEEETGEYFGVTFDKPYDEEQQAVADKYEYETCHQDTNQFVFSGYDDAIRYAVENSKVLSHRGSFYREANNDGITWHVTVEAGKGHHQALRQLAEQHDGKVKLSTIGTPLVMALFDKLKDAREYRDAAREFLASQVQKAESSVNDEYVETIILTEDCFEAEHIPPYVRSEFAESNEFEADMSFHDGYAFDLKDPEEPGSERLALYYPTIQEVQDDPDMQDDIYDYTLREWSEGSDQEKMFDTALRYGEASCIKCPKERYDAALEAIMERTKSSVAKAFSPGQCAVIQLAAACNGEFLDKGNPKSFYEQLHTEACKDLKVPEKWKQDSLEELRDLSEGKTWAQSMGRGIV